MRLGKLDFCCSEVKTKIVTLQTFEETLFANLKTKEKMLEAISQVLL
jgi:Fe-S-cluster formation regulator IscX/YfhJ